MKDQYVGDVNDMLTPNDHRSDGRRTEYLRRPHLFRHHDPALFDCLSNAMEGSRRAVSVIEPITFTIRNSLCVRNPRQLSCGSILVYQHFRREARSVFVERLVMKLENDTGASLVATVSTPHVAFFLAGQRAHRNALLQGLEELERSWSGQMMSAVKQSGR